MIQHRIIAVMQPGYLPWLGYFDLISRSDFFVVLDDVQFDKGGWRNRNRVNNNGTPLWLTVPVTYSHGDLIKDVRVSDNVWQNKHLKTIQHLYSKSPYFQDIYPVIDKYLSSKTYRWLLDLCLEGQSILSDYLGLQTSIKLSSELNVTPGEKIQRLVAICECLNGTKYLSANGSAAYMLEELWEEAGIAFQYQNVQHPVYEQSGKPFISHLSIIDMLMYAGSNFVRSSLHVDQ